MVYSIVNPLVFYPWLQYRYLSQNGSAARSANGLYLKKQLKFKGQSLTTQGFCSAIHYNITPRSPPKTRGA
ncbi:hypothetical protein DYC75_14215 [Vibrio cholerae]|nr:hypothetical protein [Vibrio cholerae]EGR2438310.1 hypothetical protein [Vibrio cholerae]EGR2532191.1 hypothetical protein [Vibrio cholerae]